jgi:hypothetical protein
MSAEGDRNNHPQNEIGNSARPRSGLYFEIANASHRNLIPSEEEKMKIRLRANTVRLRLTQSEIATLRDRGSVESTTLFAPGQALTYRLSTGRSYAASLAGNIIQITIPAADAQRWTTTDIVGLYAGCPLPMGEKLDLTLEKDFTCLLPHAPEDNVDTFPNPNLCNKSLQGPAEN